MKRIIAFITALAVIFTVPAVAFASEDYETSYAALQENEDVNEEETPEDAEPEEEEATADENIATLSLCTSIYVWPISGHTWIYVHNNSNEPIQVGHYEVPAGQGVSVGVFSFSVSDGWGIYYNVEAYKENTKNRMDNVWSKSEDINADELATLTNALLNYPNYWGFVGNCATFAFAMWNSVTHEGYFSLLIPAITQFMLMVSGAKRGTLEMYCPSRDDVYRLKGYGDNTYLERASDYTVS